MPYLVKFKQHLEMLRVIADSDGRRFPGRTPPPEDRGPGAPCGHLLQVLHSAGKAQQAG